MNCAQFDWRVVDIAAGRIDAGAAGRAHLARCERCRAHLLAERRLTAGLRDLSASLASATVPAKVEQALLAHLRTTQAAPLVRLTARVAPRAWRPWQRLLSSAALAASVLALLGVVLAHAVRDGAARDPAPFATISHPGHPEIATPFYPVYMTAAAVAGARGVVRVRVPRATLAVFGLPYNPRRATDPITADLVVDNGGMVTALRFVQ